MSNFTNSQTSRAMNTSWRSRSYSVGSKPYNSSRGTTSSSLVDYSNTENISNKQHLNRTKLPQRTASVINFSTSSSSQSRPYFTPRHSSDTSRQRNEQRKCNTQLRDSSQLSRGSTSSTESGVFSGDNSGNDIIPLKGSNDRKNHLNCPPNHGNIRGFNRYPPGIPIPTPATHFASSNSFNAPAASSLPQPPQIWLFGRAEALVKEEDLEEERVQEKNLNTFDYYNLKMLLTAEA